jgi:hypothetical protein
VEHVLLVVIAANLGKLRWVFDELGDIFLLVLLLGHLALRSGARPGRGEEGKSSPNNAAQRGACSQSSNL